MEFNKDMYDLAADLSSFAFRLLTENDTEANRNYCKDKTKVAILKCQNNNIRWMPFSKETNGKYSVGIIMQDGTKFGWKFDNLKNFNIVYNFLHAMWKNYIHGEKIDVILSGKEYDNE